LDEREDSINDPQFWTDPDTAFNMIDYPGSYHDGAGNFIFADGHGESHRWLDPRTSPPIKPGTIMPLNVSIPGDADIDWLQQHASERR
jgi:prepilin-type processing-associated H-X9-DG protein